MANTWNKAGTTWGYNSWQSDTVALSVTGVSSTSGIGSVTAFNESGWGSDAWGVENWGESGFLLTVTGVSSTFSLGAPDIVRFPGWGTLDWGENSWGDVEGATEKPSGLSITASVGTITPADVVGLTGVSATASIGSVSETRTSTQIPTGQAATFALGTGFSINNGADHAQGLAGQAVTTSVGSLNHKMTYTITGVSSTFSIGTPVITSVELIDVTGVSATFSIGSVVTETTYILTGLGMTSSVGAISPADVMGLTGLSVTASVADLTASSGGGIFGYADIDTGSNVTYTDVTAP